MRSGAALALLDRLEVILEALANLPSPRPTEADLARELASSGHHPLTHVERRALEALGKELA